MTERDALGALREDVADLRREVGALTAGMGQLVAGQEAHTALLTELLSAVAELGEDGSEGGLSEALGRIADSLDAQGEAARAQVAAWQRAKKRSPAKAAAT